MKNWFKLGLVFSCILFSNFANAQKTNPTPVTPPSLLPIINTSTADLSTDDNRNNIFQQAIHYTVRIKSTIEYPFADETKGTFNGAGFVVDKKKGWILTNAHVVGRSPSYLSLNFFGKPEISAQKVYVDPYADLAVIAIDPKKIPDDTEEAHIDCSTDFVQGIPVGTVGHPRGLSWNVTTGIISGRQNLDEEYLQIDAPLNPGNSGGPLINMENGTVLGINTAIITDSQNINFAISTQFACPILYYLRQNMDPSPILVQWNFYKNFQDDNQLKIANVYADSIVPFENDDILLKINDKPVPQNESRLIDSLRGYQGLVKFTVERKGKEVNFFSEIQKNKGDLYTDGIYFSGVLFGNIPGGYKEDLHINGVTINCVDGGSLGENAGLTKNDMIIQVNGDNINNISDFKKIMSQLKEGDTLLLKIKRISSTGNHGMFTFFEDKLIIKDYKSDVAHNLD